MNNKKQHIIHSLSDIYNYFGLKPGKGKKYKMEKEMQKDPFLADAVEGLSKVDHKKAQKDIDKINQKIRNQDKRLTKPLFLAAASLAILIIAGASYFIVQKTFNDHQPNLLTTDQTLTEKDTFSINEEAAKIEDDKEKLAVTESVAEPESGLTKPESSHTTGQSVEAPKLAEGLVEVDSDYEVDLFIAETIAPILYEPETPVAIRSEAKTGAVVSVETTSVKGIDATKNITGAFAAPEMSALEKSTDGLILKGFVIDKLLGEPIAGASIRLEGTDHVAITDYNGEFSILQADNDDNTYLAQFVGMATEEFTPTGLQYQVIALDHALVSLDEVVVTRHRSSRILPRNRRDRTDTSLNETRGFKSQPVDGFENYQQYLDENAVLDNHIELPTQPLIVKFELNNSGQPINIQTIGPANDRLKQKAINIIGDGPLWTVPDDLSEFNTEPVFLAIVFKHRH